MALRLSSVQADGAVGADHDAVADQEVAARALESGDVLEARVGAGGHPQQHAPRERPQSRNLKAGAITRRRCATRVSGTMDLCAVPCERGARWSQAPLSAGPKRNGEDAHRAAANPAGAPAILAATPSAEALVAISGVERLQGINLDDRRVDLPVPEGRRGLGWLRTAEQSRRDLDEGASDRTEDGPKSRGADWRRASEAAGF